jgi:phospholipid/cholesterol/gamma-HCH transport system substrate-binding protein
VTELRFDRQNPRVILIYIGVEESTHITRGTYAEIRPQGVTGISYIMLDDTGSNPQPLPPATERNSARIVVKPTLLESILAASEGALGDVRQVAQNLNAFLSDENRRAIGKTLASLQVAAERIGAVAQAAEPGVRNAGPLITDARKTLQQVDGVLGELSVTAKAFTGRLEAIDRVAGSAEKASTSVGALADSVASESLPRINLLVEELTRTSRNLDRFVEDIREQPQSLVFGRRSGTPGPGEPGFEVARDKGQR